MKIKSLFLSVITGALVLSGCSDDDDSYKVAWKFLSGDCESNKVVTVEAVFTNPDGKSYTGDANCSSEYINLGALPANVKYDFEVVGKDENGKVRGKAHGHTTFSGVSPIPNDFTLKPVGASVKLTWNGCPKGTILPYILKLKKGSSTVDEYQIGCSASEYEFTGVDDGEYTVELDAITTTPRVYSSMSVSVSGGEDVTVDMGVPVN